MSTPLYEIYEGRLFGGLQNVFGEAAMGVDISVNICAQPFTPDAVWDCIEPRRGRVYMVSGFPRPLSGNKAFFSLWSTEAIELSVVCKRLSFKVERVYTCWKCEHGGVAGYRIYDKGLETAEEDGSLEPALLLDGFEECFVEPLSIPADRAVFFPELLLQEPLECWLFDFGNSKPSQQHNSTIKRLLEGDTDMEPVLPFEL